MNRYIASGLLAASIAAGAGCASEQEPVASNQHFLTVADETYAYDPSKAGPKGSGQLGTSEEPLRVGERILVECIVRHESDPKGLADSAKIGDGKLKGQQVPLETFTSSVDPAQNDKPINVFGLSPDAVRAQIQFCNPPK